MRKPIGGGKICGCSIFHEILIYIDQRSTRSNARERIEKKDDVKDKAPILEKSVAAVAVAAAVAALLEGDGRTR